MITLVLVEMSLDKSDIWRTIGLTQHQTLFTWSNLISFCWTLHTTSPESVLIHTRRRKTREVAGQHPTIPYRSLKILIRGSNLIWTLHFSSLCSKAWLTLDASVSFPAHMATCPVKQQYLSSLDKMLWLLTERHCCRPPSKNKRLHLFFFISLSSFRQSMLNLLKNRNCALQWNKRQTL